MKKINEPNRDLNKMNNDFKKVTNKVIDGINKLNKIDPPVVLSAFPTDDKWHSVETTDGQVGIFVWSMPENSFVDWNSIGDKLNKKDYKKIIHISVNSLGNDCIVGPDLSPNTKITFVILNSEEDIERFSIEPYLK